MPHPRKPRIHVKGLPIDQKLAAERSARVTGAGRSTFRPSFDVLEERVLLSTTYVLSGGVLSSVTNGVATAILTQVKSFAVDSQSDVLALKTDDTLQERLAGTTSWQTFASAVHAFGIDLADNEAIAFMDTGAFWGASTIAPQANGQGNWSTVGYSGLKAPDGSFWYIGTGTADSQGDHPLHHLHGGKLDQIGAGIALTLAEGSVYSLAEPNQITRWNGQSFVSVPFAGASGVNYFLGTIDVDGTGNHSVYFWNQPDPAIQVTGRGTAIGQADDVTWLVDSSGQLWSFVSGTGFKTHAAINGPDARYFLSTANPDSQGNHRVLRWAANAAIDSMPVYAVALGVAETTVWALDAGDSVWVGNPNALSNWPVQSSVTANDGSVWFLGNANKDAQGDHAIYRWSGSHLARMPGLAVTLTLNDLATNDGVLVATDAAGHLLRWNGTTWTQPTTVPAADGSRFTRVGAVLWRSAAGNGPWRRFGNLITTFVLDRSGTNVYAMSQGNIERAPTGTTDANGMGNWTGVGYTGLTAPDGSVWYVGTDKADNVGNYTIYHLANGQLNAVGVGIALTLAEGRVYAVTNQNQVLLWNGQAFAPATAAVGVSGWYHFLGTATVDSAGDHAVYSWQITGQATKLTGRGVRLASADDAIWMLDSAGKLYVSVADAAFSLHAALAAPDGGLYFLGVESQDGQGDVRVYRWPAGKLTGMPCFAEALGLAEGSVFALDANGNVWRSNPTATSSWPVQPSQTAADGSVWFLGNTNIDGKGNHAIYRFVNGKLTTMPGQGVTLLANESQLWYVDAAHSAWRWSGKTWVVQSSLALTDGSVWFLGLSDADGFGDHYIYRSFGSQILHNGTAVRLAIADGSFWALNTGGMVMRWTANGWVDAVCARAADGSVWFLGVHNSDGHSNHAIFRWASSQPVLMPGVGVGLAASGSQLWMVNFADKAFSWNGTAWIAQATGIWGVAPGQNGLIFAFRTNGQVARTDGSTWTTVAQSWMRDAKGGIWFLGTSDGDGKGNYPVYHWYSGDVTSLGYMTALGVAEGRAWVVSATLGVLEDAPGGGWTGHDALQLPDGSWLTLGDSDADGLGDHPIYQFSNLKMINTGASAAVLVGYVENALWAANAKGQLLRWNGTDWDRMPSAESSDHKIWCLGATDADGNGNHAIYQYTGGALVQVSGMYAVGLSDTAGSVWAINNEGIVMSWGGETWSEIDTITVGNPNTQITLKDNTTMLPDGSFVVLDGTDLWHCTTQFGFQLVDQHVQSIDVVDGEVQIQYTPIWQRWHDLQDSGVDLGQATSAELTATDYLGAAVGTVIYFQRGAIFYASADGSVTDVSKHIADIYLAYQANGKALGVPTHKLTDGANALEGIAFTNGIIYWSPVTDGRVLADDAVVHALGQPADGDPAFSATNGTEAWDVLKNLTNTDFGVHTSAVGTLSLNLSQQTAYVDLQFMGTHFNTDDLAAILDDSYQAPQVNPLEGLTSLSRANVTNDYIADRDAAYKTVGGADTVYFSSSRFVDWASPQTVARLTGEAIFGATDAAKNELKNEASAEIQALLAWATRRWGGEVQAMAMLAQAIAQGHLQIVPIKVNYYYTVLGQEVTEPHLGFKVIVTNMPKGSLVPQNSLIATDSAPAQVAAGVGSDFIGNALGNFGKDLMNEVLGTELDTAEFDLGGSIAGNLAKTAVYKLLYQQLNLSPTLLMQSYSGNPVINLLQLNPQMGQKLEAYVDSKLGSDFHFHVKEIWFNTSTYELSAKVKLDYDHSWGTASQIMDKVGQTLSNWGQQAGSWAGQAGGKAADWFKKEAGVVASWYQDVAGKAAKNLPPWVGVAVTNLPQAMQDLGQQAQKVSDLVANMDPHIEQTPLVQKGSDILSGSFLTDAAGLVALND